MMLPDASIGVSRPHPKTTRRKRRGIVPQEGIMKSKIDIGLIWAKYLNIWGQLGSVVGAVNTLMMIGVFYTTTVKPSLAIPIWLYLVTMVVGVVAMIGFILRWGISGYYRFWSNQSDITSVNRKIDLIMKYLDIKDDNNKTKM